MMKTAKKRFYHWLRLGLLIVAAVAFMLSMLPRSATAAATTSEILYRGNAQRTGAYDMRGVPSLSGTAWKASVGEAGFSSPVYADGMVYIGNNRGEVRAFDAKTGEEQWAFTSVGGNASPVAIAGGVVFAGLGTPESRGMGLFALDSQTGKQLWAFKTDGPIWLSAPLLYDGAAYFGDMNGVLYSVDLKTHQELWRVTTNRAVLWHAAAEGDVVYFTASEKMIALDAHTGEQKWQISIGTNWMPHAVQNGLVYAGDGNHRFYALDAQTGKELWTFKDTPTDRAEWSAPAIGNGVVYAGNRTGFMYAFDAPTGKELWKFKAAAPATSDPIIANGILYFGVGAHGNLKAEQTEAYFYAVNAKTGDEIWKFKAEGEIFNGPALADDMVYFLTAASHLYALH
jgi:eukaryotic-like serine/threonine-protein kinase